MGPINSGLADQSRTPMYYTTRRTREVELLCTDCH